jgi:hypothetical protein
MGMQSMDKGTIRTIERAGGRREKATNIGWVRGCTKIHDEINLDRKRGLGI